MLTRLDSAPRAAEELAVGELAAGTLEGAGGLGVRVQGRQRKGVRLRLSSSESSARQCRATARAQAAAAALRPRLEDVQPGARGFRFACANRSLDPIEPTPEDDQRGGDLPSSA